MRFPSSSQDERNPAVVLVGLDTLHGIQAARILARHRIPVIAIAKDPDHYGAHTKVCREIINADTGSEALIDTIISIGKTLDQKAILMPCTDTIVMLVSQHRDKLKEWYHIALPAHEAVVMLMDKVGFYTFAQENGFPIPATRFLKSRSDAERAAQELTFPCVLKPPMSSAPVWEKNSKLKAYRVEAPDEFLNIYDLSTTWVENMIAQEWVVGPDNNLYSCNCYFDAQAQPLVTFVARKLRQWPPVSGESSLGEECRDDAVLDITLQLFKKAQLHGLGYVEIKQDSRTGKYYIIEPNIGRPTGRSAIAEGGGVELLYTMYCDLLGLPLPEQRQQSYQGVKWVSLRRDFQSALYHLRAGDLTLKGWWKSMRGRKVYALLSWSDPGPFFWDLYRAVRLYMIPAERKKRDFRNL